MLARAQHTVFWPGIFNDLEVIRARCRECNVKAPSQAALPPRQLASPEYPFHMIVADCCTIKSRTWLVVADRFTGWVSVKELITILREMFSHSVWLKKWYLTTVPFSDLLRWNSSWQGGK